MKQKINAIVAFLLIALAFACSDEQKNDVTPVVQHSNERTAATCYTQQTLAGSPSLKWPLKDISSNGSTEVIQGYGVAWSWAKCGKYDKIHTGWDLMYKVKNKVRPSIVGTEVVAVFDGKVAASVDLGSGWGNALILTHSYTYKDASKKDVTISFTSNYTHILPKSNLKVGDSFKKGDVIAKVADIERNGSVPHLHFGLRLGAYHSTYSIRGALPDARVADDKCACEDSKGYYDRVFPENMVDPSKVSILR